MDGALYDRYGEPGASFVLVPGVAAEGQDPDEVEEIIVPLGPRAYPVTMTLTLRQANHFVQGKDGPMVAGLSQWGVAMNGVPVYYPLNPARTTLAAMVSALDAIGKLMTHPVRWWQERSWKGRPVWYQGVPARITHFWPERGECGLHAEGGSSFVPQGRELEAGFVPDGEQRAIIMVDILSADVDWTRTRAATETYSRASVGTQDDAPVVDSVDRSREVDTDGDDD